MTLTPRGRALVRAAKIGFVTSSLVYVVVFIGWHLPIGWWR